MWSPNELLKIEKQRDILSYITLQFFHFKKVPLEHCPFHGSPFYHAGWIYAASRHSTRFISRATPSARLKVFLGRMVLSS